MAKPHVLIVGAGIGGLTSAIALLMHGASVDIFEQAAAIEDLGAGLQLGPNAMKVLTALGLKDPIYAAAFEPEFTAFRDYKTGEAELHILMKGEYEERYGAKYLNIHRADLHRILLDAAQRHGAQIHFAAHISGFTQHTDYIEVNSNALDIKGDVLIGADGIHSKAQAQMFGQQTPRFTGQVAWRGTVPTDAVPSGTLPPTANNWMGPGQHFVSYYIRGGDMINFVAVKEQESWTEESWHHPGDLSELRNAFKGWDHPVTDILAACQSCFLWGLFDRAPLSSWTDGRAALLGDAAHPMLPFAAQGAAMAIEDSWVIAHHLINIDCISTALKAYVAARKPRATMIQSLSAKNAKLYHEGGRFGRLKRRITFRVGSRLQAAQNYRLDPIFGADVVRDYPIS